MSEAGYSCGGQMAYSLSAVPLDETLNKLTVKHVFLNDFAEPSTYPSALYGYRSVEFEGMCNIGVMNVVV